MLEVYIAGGVIQFYALIYLLGALSYNKSLSEAIPPFNIFLLMRESLAWVARWLGSNQTLTVNQTVSSWIQGLGLDPGKVTMAALENATRELTEEMQTRWVSYPESQYKVVTLMTKKAIERIQDIERARQAKESASLQAAAPAGDWRRILGVPNDEMDAKAIKTAYARLVRKEHPDRGGTGERMPQLNAAIEAARAEIGFV